MKTNPIFRMLMLAAVVPGLWTDAAQAQPPYSLNVVGYYNVPISPGGNILANQLFQTNFNANCVIGGADGSLLYRFDPVSQTYHNAGTYLAGLGWCSSSGDTNDPVLDLPPGEGFYIWSPTSWTATFVGVVAQGTLINPLPGGYSMKASIVPQSGALQTDLIFPPRPGDIVWKGIGASFSPYAYEGSDTNWAPSEPSIDVGRGFFLYREPAEATQDHWWARNFTVQKSLGPLPSPPGPKDGVAARITSMRLQEGSLVLAIRNASGAPYRVQFSADRVSWQTVAVGQTGARWQEPIRAGVQGYYQLVNP